MKRILVLGAGPTGLGAGFRLKEAGFESFRVYEKNGHVGGLSSSFTDEKGFTWDIGGHIIFSNIKRFNDLLERLLGHEALKHSRESWIWLRDTFIKYPFQNNFHFLPEEDVLECLLGLVETNGRGPSYNNFEQWIYSHFGRGIAERFMVPYNRKVWACPLDSMDYNWIAERVSVIDLKTVLRNIIQKSDDSAWGPNSTFSYPLHGGTAGLFQKFLPFLEGELTLGSGVESIDIRKKEVSLSDGSTDRYDALVSTIPLNELVASIKDAPGHVREASGKLLWNGGFMVGIGLAKRCPSNKNWMYFPQPDSPFYRVTYLSNYSPNLTPRGEYFSLLAETSYSRFRPVSRDTIIEETVQGLINSRILSEEDRRSIVSTYLIDAPYSFPIPFLGRDGVVRDIQEYLEENGIYSRGRFGGWKYEVGNMDHSVMQGMEAADRILFGKKESVYRF